MQTNYEGAETDPNGTDQDLPPKSTFLAVLFLLGTAAIWWACIELFDIPVNPLHWFQ